MAWTGLVNRLLFIAKVMISGHGDFCLPQWIKVCCTCLLTYNRNTGSKTNSRSARSLFLHLLKHSVKFRIMKHTTCLILQSLILFTCNFFLYKKWCLCVCQVLWISALHAPETKTGSKPGGVQTLWVWDDFCIATALKCCLLTAFWHVLFCFPVICMTCVENNRINFFKLKLGIRKFCFSNKNKWLDTAIKTFCLVTTGNVKIVVPTESTHVKLVTLKNKRW